VYYKDTILKHKFYADFGVFDEIILEVKSTKSIPDDFIAMGLNYLKFSENKVGLIVNFGRQSLEWKRIVY
jgi:GxxExxY protein